MPQKQSSIGAVLSKEAHAALKEFGPVSTISSLILACLSRQIPYVGEELRQNLKWTEIQTKETVRALGSNPFPLAGASLYEVANSEQAIALDQTTIFEQIALEFVCLRAEQGKIDPPQVSRDKGIGLTLRINEATQNWWQKQFTHTQPGVSHILMAATDWIMLTFEEDVFLRLEKHKELLSYALANTEITDPEELNWVVQSKLQAFTLGDYHRGIPEDLLQILQAGIPEFTSLCLVLKYGYGNQTKQTVSPRLSAGTVKQLTDLFGNKNTAVAFTAEAFPQLYYATMGEEIMKVFTREELEALASIARKNNIGPPEGEFPGLALRKLANLPQSESYRDRIQGLSLFAKMCMEVAVVSCHYIRQGPAVSKKRVTKKKA